MTDWTLSTLQDWQNLEVLQMLLAGTRHFKNRFEIATLFVGYIISTLFLS